MQAERAERRRCWEEHYKNYEKSHFSKKKYSEKAELCYKTFLIWAQVIENERDRKEARKKGRIKQKSKFIEIEVGEKYQIENQYQKEEKEEYRFNSSYEIRAKEGYSIMMEKGSSTRDAEEIIQQFEI